MQPLFPFPNATYKHSQLECYVQLDKIFRFIEFRYCKSKHFQINSNVFTFEFLCRVSLNSRQWWNVKRGKYQFEDRISSPFCWFVTAFRLSWRFWQRDNFPPNECNPMNVIFCQSDAMFSNCYRFVMRYKHSHNWSVMLRRKQTNQIANSMLSHLIYFYKRK